MVLSTSQGGENIIEIKMVSGQSKSLDTWYQVKMVNDQPKPPY
jgi:hypothetical protein